MGWKTLVNLSHLKAPNIHLIPEKTRKKSLEANCQSMWIHCMSSQYRMKDPQVEMVFSTVHKFKGL